MSYFFAQLPYLAVQVAVDGGGIVLALSYMNRAKRPAMFVLGGCVILLATTLITSLITGMLIGGRPGNVAAILGPVNILGNLLRAVGIGLLFAAAFVDRDSAPAAIGGSLQDRIGKVCAACGARGPTAASFCMHCGAAHSSSS